MVSILSELPARVQRLAYREFSKNPDLSNEDFQRKVSQEFFGKPDVKDLTDDLLFLQRCINYHRDWAWSSPLVDPQLYDRKARNDKWRTANKDEIGKQLARLRTIAAREPQKDPAVSEMQKIAQFIVKRWEGKTP